MDTENTPEQTQQQLTIQRIALRAATPDLEETQRRFYDRNRLIIVLLAAGVFITVLGFFVSITKLVPPGWPLLFSFVGLSLVVATGIWNSSTTRTLKRVQHNTVILDAYDTLIDRYRRGETVTDEELLQFHAGVSRLLAEEPDQRARRSIILYSIGWIVLTCVIVIFWLRPF